jgi:hypothetical protein
VKRQVYNMMQSTEPFEKGDLNTFYARYLKEWNALVIGCSNCNDLEIFGRENMDSPWIGWLLEDEKRPTLPAGGFVS